MKLVARIHIVKNRMYERLMFFLARYAPKTNEHINDKPFIVAAAPAMANFCLYCLWTYMLWDDLSEMWTCPKCGLSCHPPLAITEKRPVVQPRVVSSKLVTLPEQRAVQPPYTPHIFSLAKAPSPRPYVPGRYLKAITGEIEMRDGKPCHKNGSRVNTEEFKRIIFPPTDERRTG